MIAARTVPVVAVAGSAAMWGVWWLPLRALDAGGLRGEWASVAVFGCASLLLAPLAWRRRHRIAAAGWSTIAIGILFGLALVTWNHALIAGEVVRVTLMFYLSPVWGTLLGIIVLGLRPNRMRILTIAVGLAGAVVVLGFTDGFPMPRSVADWMGLASGVFFAAAAVLTNKIGKLGDVERTIATFVAAMLLALVLATVMPFSPPPRAAAVVDVLPLLIAVTALWYMPITWLIIWGAARLDPGRVSILLLLEVGVAAVSSSLLTDETLGLREAIGGFLIVAAGALEAIDALRTPPPSAGADHAADHAA